MADSKLKRGNIDAKHIDVRYHYRREIIDKNIVKINDLPTEDIPAIYSLKA